jgi:hypothetical protein
MPRLSVEDGMIPDLEVDFSTVAQQNAVPRLPVTPFVQVDRVGTRA